MINKFAAVMPELGVPTYEKTSSGYWKKADPAFQTYKEEVWEMLRHSGEVESLFGRKRRFPGLYHLRRCRRCKVITYEAGREYEWDVAPVQLWNYTLHAYVYGVRDIRTGSLIATTHYRKQLQIVMKRGLCEWPFRQISYRSIRRIEVGHELVHFMPIEDCQRQGFNAVIQATAGDVFKKAILAVQPVMLRHDAKMIINVHDELVFSVPTTNLHSFVADLIPAMIKPPVPWWEIPIEVDVEVGPNYGELATYQLPGP
jgi:DNA polymerase I-like protein with 3'-5' exonuclease and polymerase domains